MKPVSQLFSFADVDTQLQATWLSTVVSNHSSHSSFWEPWCSLLLLEIRPLVLRCLTESEFEIVLPWTGITVICLLPDAWARLAHFVLTLESELFLKGFTGDLIRFGILQDMMLLFSLSDVYSLTLMLWSNLGCCLSSRNATLVVSLLMRWGVHSVLQAGSVSWFLPLAHPWSCCGSCCVQAPEPLALEVSGFSSWCPGV